jgi:hypothetical protein
MYWFAINQEYTLPFRWVKSVKSTHRFGKARVDATQPKEGHDGMV